MKETCIFCDIASGVVPSTLVYQDDLVVAFDDLSPQAPFHKLIIPKRHITSLNEINEYDNHLIGHLVYTATHLAHKLEIAESGYRLVLNCNADGGQTVFHLHLHLMGGRSMHWPPG